MNIFNSGVTGKTVVGYPVFAALRKFSLPLRSTSHFTRRTIRKFDIQGNNQTLDFRTIVFRNILDGYRSFWLCMFVFAAFPNFIPAQNLQLPSYYIEIDKASLSKLYSQPYSNDYLPASVRIEDSSYSCGLRFRGASARTLPKKSWKLKFDNNNNPFKSDKINFNSQYRDKSLIRNFLTNKLFEYMGQPAPQIDFVNLFINGDYYGVFEQIEELEEEFLKRNEIARGSVYKARNHAANFGVIPKYREYFGTWDKQTGDEEDYSDLQNVLNMVFYMNSAEFESGIEKHFNIENILSYFAIQFAIFSFDSFTKNYNFYVDPDYSNAMLFPWDNDASFGNHWSGQYKQSYITNIDGNFDKNFGCLRFNVLFQRLMEYKQWRDRLNEKVVSVITGGFNKLSGEIDSVYNLISHDYHLDPNKGYSNSVFDAEAGVLKSFLRQRKEFLLGKQLFNRVRVSEYFCSNPFLKSGGFSTFSVRLSEPADVVLDYITDYEFGSDRDYTVTTVRLFDDGQIQDVAANDLIYSTNISLPRNPGGIYIYTFRIGDLYYPANGYTYLENRKTVSLAMSPVNRDINVAQNLKITGVSSLNREQWITIKNNGSETIDLTYFHLRGSESWHDFVFPPELKINSGESIIVATNDRTAQFISPGNTVLEKLTFQISAGDTIKLLDPSLNILNSYSVEKIDTPVISTENVVINEINYHSPDSMDTGDWIELYNPNPFPVYLDEWKFTDSKATHIYTFPKSAVVNADEYFVLCNDVDSFIKIFPDIKWRMGNFDFGLNNGGEVIKLFDRNEILIDEVEYFDSTPWPEEADGDGATLELINPELDNNLESSWAASDVAYGTPGKQNSTFRVTGIVDQAQTIPMGIKVYPCYPNPFNSYTNINFEVSAPTRVKINMFDIAGRQVKTILEDDFSEGVHNVPVNSENLVSGVYFYRIETSFGSEIVKTVLMK